MRDEPLTILLVDDSPEDRELYRRALMQDAERQVVFLKADTGREGLDRCRSEKPDCILLDFNLPDLDGLEFLTALGAESAEHKPAVVMLTGQGNEAVAVEAMKRGAQDYVLKGDVTAESLQRAVRHAVGKVALEHEIAKQQQDLARSNRELERASRVKDEFLAKMSHELRTPLNSIIGFTEMMMHDTKDPPAGKRATRLEKVHRNGQNLLALINDILDISKIEAKQLTLARDSVDATTLIGECVELVEPLIKKDAVELRQQLDESLVSHPDWTGDALRLQQVVMNLLSNAAKFTERGHVEVRGSVTDGFLVIEVEDTGLGIPKEHLSRIFDDFHQVDSSSTRRAGGTGLGLAICTKLCQLMGGEITATSTLGIGSLFTIRLPIAQLAGDTGQAGQPPVLYAGTQVSVHRVRHFVQGLAAHVECVTEMRRAVEYCQQHSPGILYIDPSWHDALELLATLKRYDSTKRIPIGLLGVAADRAALVTFDDCVAFSLGKNTLHRILRGTCESPRVRVLLFLERRAENQYLHEMLAEFPDIVAMTAASEREAEAYIAGGELDAVLVDLLDTRGEGLEFVARHDRTSAAARPRLIAVTPRDPSNENILALSRAFELHIARQGQPVARILRRLYDEAVPLEELRQADCLVR